MGIVTNIKDFFKRDGKKLIYILAATGILLTAISLTKSSINTDKDTTASTFENSELVEYGERLEQKLADTICAAIGRDSVEVMITFNSTFENVYAGNTVSDGFSNNYSQEISFSSLSDGKVKQPIVIKRNCPKISGVMIVCKKYISPQDCLTVKKAVSTALNISESKIYIIGGEAANEKNTQNN